MEKREVNHKIKNNENEKLLLLLCAAMTIFLAGCESKHQVTAQVNFTVQSDVRTQADITKIEELIKSKGLPIGATMITVDGDSEKDIENRAKEILTEFLFKVSDEELRALNTGATVVYYRAALNGLSSAIATAKKEL